MAGLGGGQRQAGAKGTPLASSRACLQRAAQKGAAPSAWAASPAVPSKGAYKERFSLSRHFPQPLGCSHPPPPPMRFAEGSGGRSSYEVIELIKLLRSIREVSGPGLAVKARENLRLGCSDCPPEGHCHLRSPMPRKSL